MTEQKPALKKEAKKLTVEDIEKLRFVDHKGELFRLEQTWRGQYILKPAN